jgi:tellurite methyltransferase
MSDKNISLEKNYWNTFYNKWVIDIPSQFCVQMLTEIDNKHTIVEFSSGNGRDAHYMAHQGHMVVAMDLSPEAVAKSSALMQDRDIEHGLFSVGDVSSDADVSRVLSLGRDKGHTDNRSVVVYSRFVLHSLDDQQQELFLRALSTHLLPGDRLFLEFRCSKDADTEKIFGDHYRRYVDTDSLLRDLCARFGFEIDYSLTGQGMAKYRGEDPFVSRIIASKL